MWMFAALYFTSIVLINGEETSSNTTGNTHLEINCILKTDTTDETDEKGWKCTSGRQLCIPVQWLCDGVNDCDGGEDEGEVCGSYGDDRTCTNPLTGKAVGWRCTSGSQQCIHSRYLCDGRNHCDGGEDEGEVCGGYGDDRTCTNPLIEEAVGWRCKSGSQQCIHSRNLCDGWNNCDGGEDEGEVCGGYGNDRKCINPLTKQVTRWRCTSGSQQCIHSSYLCDGYNDCDEGEDEGELCGGHGDNRTCTSPLTKEAVGWRCKSGSRKCINCIGHNDCDKEEDNEVCGGHGVDRRCTSPLTGEVIGWRCTSGRQQCIHSRFLCDGDNNCVDGDDEGEVCGGYGDDRKCTNPLIIDTNRTRCTVCISNIDYKRLTCDGREDCDGGIDEQGCGWYIIVGKHAITICAGIVALSFLLLILLRKRGLISTFITKKYDIGGEGFLQGDLSYIDKFVDKIERSETEDDDLRKIYSNIHKLKQIPKLFVVLKIRFIELSISNKISKIVTKFEEELHGSRRQAMLCLRVNGGSNENVKRILAFEDDPGFPSRINKKIIQLLDATLNQNCLQSKLDKFPKIKKILLYIPKLLKAFVRLTLFLLDSVKDIVLWAILYDKSNDNNQTEQFLIWTFLFFIFFAQAVVGLFIASNFRSILSIPNDTKMWKQAIILVILFISTPVVPSIVIFKATIYSTNISTIIANARKTRDKASEVLQQVEELKEKERIYSQIYAYARVIESTLETYPQINITISFVVDYIVDGPFSTGPGSVLLNANRISSLGTILFLISIPHSIIMIITSITNLVNNQKRGSLGLIESSISGMSFFFQLMSSMVCSIYILFIPLYGKDTHYSYLLFSLLLINILVTWCFTFVFTRKNVKQFSESPIRQQVFHILVNTYVTIPYRDIKDEKQRKKSFEIFWHMVFRCSVNMIMAVTGFFISQDYFDPDDHRITLIGIIFCSVLLASCVLQLLGGLFMWIFYKVHPWKEIINSSVNFCYLPFSCCPSLSFFPFPPVGLFQRIGSFFLGLVQFLACGFCCCLCDGWLIWCRCFGLHTFRKLGWKGKDLPDRKLAVEELVIVTPPQSIDEKVIIPLPQPHQDQNNGKLNFWSTRRTNSSTWTLMPNVSEGTSIKIMSKV